VRELFNHLDRCLALQTPLGPHETIKGQPALAIDGSLRYSEARQAAVDRFEHSYAVALLKLHGGKVTDAAKAAGIDRAYLHRLMRRHGIKT
jgi:two-component system response regulator GlrR